MILRKKLQLLFLILHILCDFDNERSIVASAFENKSKLVTRLKRESAIPSSDDLDLSTTEHFENPSTSYNFLNETTTEIYCEEIPQVNNLTVTTVDDGLYISWDPPEDVICLESYLVEVTNIEDYTNTSSVIVSSQITYHTFNLSTCATYEITVTPISKDDSHGITTAVNKTLTYVPDAVTDLSALQTSISIYLNWSAPTSYPNCVQYYIVTICDDNNCVTNTANNLFYNATNLNPCVNYMLTVNAVGAAGSSEDTTIDVTTETIRPGQVTSVTAEPGEYSLDIHWVPPTEGRTCITAYRITLYHDSRTDQTNDTKITVTNLSACHEYEFQIIAVASPTVEGNPVVARGNTKASVHDPPVLEIKKPSVTASTITLGWRIERNMNECNVTSIITYCNYTSTEGDGIILVDRQSEDFISNVDSTANIYLNVTVYELSPFTYYNCRGLTRNYVGVSTTETSVSVRTSEDIPSAPNVTFYYPTSSSFLLRWEKPQYLPGILIEHEITLLWKPLFLMPSFCSYNGSSKTISNISSSIFEYYYLGATPYSNYTARIRAKTNAGWGNYSDYVILKTSSDVPGTVTNLVYLNKTSDNDVNKLDTFLFWQLPCSLNGIIDSFNITVYGTRDNFEPHELSIQPGAENVTSDKIFSINFGELKAEYNYTFEISAKVLQVSEYGPSVTYNTIYPAGIPPIPEESYMKKIAAYPYNSQRTTSTAKVLLPLFQNTNGLIKYYAIMVSQKNQSQLTFQRFDIISGQWPNTNSWKKAMAQNPIVNYQATPIRWDAAYNITDFGHLKAVIFILGEDVECPEKSVNSNSTEYCNGPLRPDTEYYVRMRAFTNGGYCDSEPIIVITKAEFKLGLVIGVVLGILFVGMITTMALLVRKSGLQAIIRNPLNPRAHTSPVPHPLPKKKFEIHCQDLSENPGKLSNEFQLLQTLSVDLQMSTNDAILQANRKKNRYLDILPYDISRVKLDILDNDPNTDYINASFIHGYSEAVEYIACQGPKEETTYDFWRMIFEYNVKIVVMVTQLVEKNKEKCHQYYPNTRENFEYEDITVRCSTQLDFDFYTQRTITLQKEDVKRTIMHLHFKEWTDHGVPDDFHSLIHFCQVVRKQITNNKGMAVVHCSAGVGRTGTLIAVDILLQHIRDNKKLDVFGTVFNLRKDRINMVQTESQYAYIYNCVRQALNNPFTLKHHKSLLENHEFTYASLRKKQKELTDSSTNLVNSTESLKKISPSSSMDSMEPIYELVRQRPIHSTHLNSFSNGLRYTKSTGAIDLQISPSIEMVRYGSHEYPIFEPARDTLSNRGSVEKNILLESKRPLSSRLE